MDKPKLKDTRDKMITVIEQGRYFDLASQLSFEITNLMNKQVDTLNRMNRADVLSEGRKRQKANLTNDVAVLFAHIIKLTDLDIDELINEIGGE